MDMELIVRYEGEKFAPNPHQSDDILAKLKQKAEKRRLQALHKVNAQVDIEIYRNVVEEVTNGHVNELSTSKKHRKKAKLLAQDMEGESVKVAIGASDDDHQKNNKKRKKKSETKQPSSEQEKIDIQEEDEPAGEKKKKKRKSVIDSTAIVDVTDSSDEQKRKKKKKSSDSEAMVNGVHLESDESSPPRKLKKNTGLVRTTLGTQEQGVGDVELGESVRKSKKKKSKAAVVEPADASDDMQETENVETPKKVNKKKKSIKNNFAAVDLADAIDASDEPKKKKKTKLTDSKATVNGPHSDSVSSSPRRKRKNNTDETKLVLPSMDTEEQSADDVELGESAWSSSKKMSKAAVVQPADAAEEAKIAETSEKVIKKKRKKASKKNPATVDLADNGEFTVIGQVMDLRPQEVSQFLPEWLQKPITFSTDLHDESIGVKQLAELHPNIIATLKDTGVLRLFPVQACLVPWMLRACRPGVIRPNDVCVSAPTGSGKTLAFVLPIVHALRGRVVRKIRALVVLPVHELAVQVFKVFKVYCGKNNNLDVGLAAGEVTLEIEQSSLVRKGFRGHHSLVDILVCTPGRLVDHIKMTEGFTLKGLRFMVIDEADRMMEHIKQGWLQKVENCVSGVGVGCVIPITPSSMPDLQCIPQKLLFSATLSHDPEKLEMLKLFQPKLFIPQLDKNFETIKEEGTSRSSLFGLPIIPNELSQFSCVCEIELKPLVMLHLLHQKGYRHVLCFTNSKKNSARLTNILSCYGGLVVVEFSSVQRSDKRRQLLDRFKAGLVDVIVCTDAMARGIHIEDVQYVISYDMPMFANTYVHRVGRTARAGRSGTAISLLSPGEEGRFNKLMSAVGIKNIGKYELAQSELEPLVKNYQVALDKAVNIVKTESIRKINKTR